MIDETEHYQRVLLARRFPAHAHRILLGQAKAIEAASPGDAKAVGGAYLELSRLPETKLRELYRSEVDQIRAESNWLSRCLGPWAPPDYDHWATMSLWPMDETALLLLDRDPETVKVPFEKATVTSKFESEFGRLREVLERAVSSGQLYRRTDPAKIMRWVLNRGLSVPARLERAVREKTEFVDWQAVAQSEREQHEAIIEDLRKKLQSMEADLERLRSERRRDPRAERSEMKVLYAMATARPYNFKPNQDTSPGTIAKLDSALANADLELDHDTVLAVLKRAAKVVDEDLKRVRSGKIE